YAPGIEGQLGILPHHAPLMTTLQPGELRVRKDGEEFSLAISGGFLEVRPDRIIVPADDYTDPGVATTFGHLDAVIALERSIAEQGLYPAVDPLTST
ncbi:unnamed protein product, partial [marine sediment metagenome]